MMLTPSHRTDITTRYPHGDEPPCYACKADQGRLVRLSGLRRNSPTVHRRAGMTNHNHPALEDVQGLEV